MSAIDRRSLLLACLVGLAGVTAASAQLGPQRRLRRRRRGDHDDARRALCQGRARPLAEILPRVKQTLGGEVIDVELEDDHGAMRYQFKVLRADGQLVELAVDALTGQILPDND